MPGLLTGSSSPDEGYQEHDLIPRWLLDWPEDQRAELAVQLLRSVSSSTLTQAYRRLTPLIEYRDFLVLLPYELAVHILSYLDAETLYEVALVSKAWNRCASDSSVWKALYFKRGWTVNEDMVNWYLESTQRLWQIGLHTDYGLSAVGREKRRAEEGLSDDDDMALALSGSEDDMNTSDQHRQGMLLDTYPGSTHDLPSDVMMEQISDEDEQFFTPVANSQQLQPVIEPHGTTPNDAQIGGSSTAQVLEPTSDALTTSTVATTPSTSLPITTTTATAATTATTTTTTPTEASSSSSRPATFPRWNNSSSKYNRFLISPSNILPTIQRPRLPSYNLSGSFITPPSILKRSLNRSTPPPIRIPPRTDNSTTPPGLRPPKFFQQYSVPFMRSAAPGSPVSPSSPTMPTATDASSPQPTKGLWSTIRHGVMGVSGATPWPSLNSQRNLNNNSSSDESAPEGGPSHRHTHHSPHRVFHNLSPFPTWLHLPSPLAYTSRNHRDATSGAPSTSMATTSGAVAERSLADGTEGETFSRNRRALPHAIPFNSPTAPPPSQVLAPETFVIHQCPHSQRPCINWKYLYQQRKLLENNWANGRHRAKELPGHKEGIYCIQFDDYKIVSGSRDNTIKVWDFATGECLRTYSGHGASVLCLQYDDSRIVSGSSDATIIVWELDTGAILQRLTGHSDSVLNVRMEKDTVVSCSKDRTVKIWRTSTGELVRTLVGHRAAVNAVQFSLEGSTNSFTGSNRIVVSASGDRTIKIWSFETGECLRTLEGHTRGIACIQFEGDTIISGSSDQTIKIWDLARGECVRTLSGHLDLVRTLQFHKGKIISGGYDETIKIWDQESGALMVDLQGGHEHRIFKLQFNDSKIVSCSQDQKDDLEDERTGASSVSTPASPNSASSGSTGTIDQPGRPIVLNMAHTHKGFKKPGWHGSKKTKNLKQILTMEKAKEWKPNTPTFWNIEALPSMTPQKKYCDITGLEARYTDPKTRLRYHSAEVYQLIKNQPIGVVQMYLGLRNAAVVLK
ncbi:chromatin-remodeling complex subunit ies6 [Actinomortierella wolfii]|nr:chromatin-remodeling complex subunit ies6 [Actinomortierella wolfii]